MNKCICGHSNGQHKGDSCLMVNCRCDKFKEVLF